MKVSKIEINNRFKVLANKTQFSINSIFRNKAVIGLLFLFPLFSILVPVIFVPFWSSAAFAMQLNVILTTGLIYGTLVFGFKKSTLSKNEKLITKSRSVGYLSAFIVICLIVFISSGIQLILLILFNNLNLLMPDWLKSGFNSERGYDFSNLKYLGWYWSIFWTMMITFGIFFACRNFIQTEKGHFTIVITLLILSVIWGGTLNDYWPGMVYVESIGDYERLMSGSLFPKSLYWPTLIIFPFFAPGQFASQVADFTITSNGIQWSEYAAYDHPVVHLSFAKDYKYAAEWNAMIIAPIVWTSVLCGIGLVFKTK